LYTYASVGIFGVLTMLYGFSDFEAFLLVTLLGLTIWSLT
jgi:hypothetical protein